MVEVQTCRAEAAGEACNSPDLVSTELVRRELYNIAPPAETGGNEHRLDPHV